jgi:hypothetical protein
MVAAILASATLALLLAWPGAARACSCSGERAIPLWPVDGAQGVPVDTPVLVAASATRGLRVELRELGGAALDVEVVRALDGPGGCEDGVVFLKARQDLAAERYYTLTAVFDGPRGPATPSVFRTGAGRRAPRPPEVRLSLLAAHAGSHRALFVFGEHQGGDPAVLAVASRAGNAVRPLGRTSSEEPAGLQVEGGDCVSVELADLEGRAVRSERLCEPQSCIEHRNIPVEPCTRHAAPGTFGLWQDGRRACGAASGCSLAGAASRSGGVLPAPLALAGAVALARRRHRPRAGRRFQARRGPPSGSA